MTKNDQKMSFGEEIVEFTNRIMIMKVVIDFITTFNVQH